MKNSSCFIGHRDIDANMTVLSLLLCSIFERLIAGHSVTDFYAGGAIWFDTVAADTVLRMREKYPQVKLHLVLPCSNADQTKNWTAKQVAYFNRILGLANSVEYISDRYYNGCMNACNARLVELASECCISYWNPNDFRSGTGQTVRMARKKGIPVINLFEILSNGDNSPVNGLTDMENRSIMELSNLLEVTAMPRKKKTDTTVAPATEVKAEVVTEAVKETVADAPAEKPAKKPATKKTPAKKTATKAKTSAKSADEKKTTAKAKTTTKTAAKATRATKTATAPVETVKVQFGGDEFDFAEIKKAVEADYKSKFKGKVKTIEFYIKPEDKAVYYVINGDFSGKIEL